MAVLLTTRAEYICVTPVITSEKTVRIACCPVTVWSSASAAKVWLVLLDVMTTCVVLLHVQEPWSWPPCKLSCW